MTALTGVGAHLSAIHHDLASGTPHGHTWDVTAWFEYRREVSALDLQGSLKRVLSDWDHGTIPDELARAEDLAAEIGSRLQGCVAVDIARLSDRLFARWTPLATSPDGEVM